MSQKETQIIDTLGMNYEGLTGKLLQDRYLIGKIIARGGNSVIYQAQDTKHEKSSTKLIVKFSEKYLEMSEEIKILLRLGKAKSKLFDNKKNGLVPKILNYGMVVMKNLTTSSSSLQNEKLVGYAVMKKCSTSIENYFVN